MVTSGRLPRRAAGFVAAAVTMAALTGCSTAPAVTSGFDAADLDAALGKVPADLSAVHGLDLPLDPSLLTPVEELEVVKARNTLMERCLAGHGLAFTFPAVDPVRDAAKPRRYGLVDAGEAAAYGYRDPAIFTARGAGATAPQPPPEVVSVITGTHAGEVGGHDVPAGGCAGEADRTLATDGKPGQEPVSFALSGRSHEIARTAPPVTAAAEAWSRCMAAAGFRYARPDAAINDPAFAVGRPSPHEIAVATQDVRCKESVEWVRTWVGVERAGQDVLVRQHPTDLRREREHKQQQLAVAREVNG
ncbi:hypothetical protein AMES_8054 [Amycolatopsis mediterranei S699]|uniref:Lipoprotein n=2 Tax=Amycolatopsis mediterranei TaxID=33910 RepID=A0A0H3DJM5_AMYMU|nr:hypothetical protein [Amycolatopsis mediterranei]ADJ49879.1 hypothetical protein AMED_8179 [Amycolatopsis mediterranei U32]AEK46869.1 hypothetical protein RAM_42010 [Amycolatopsis mediterranei S699]AFO81587.1 hypothetical protein AMES_8054 [Amycolatopsis mediterranei S699]AGT88716.1 hypothetical protein B737_8055 [Amycolatopsis mediterranei RB]KDO07872.1 hypothetical protein DV26_26665 [Amycolatopsis mediterranei]